LLILNNMKADLHNHLLIGFQPKWLNLQGYSGRNLAGILLENARKRKTDIVVITSEAPDIKKGSDDDRFSRICKDAEKLHDGGRNYTIERIGENILKIKGKNFIYVVNGQTVIVLEKGRRYDHLVVGSNQVPNGKTFDYVINYCYDNNLLNFLEHPGLEEHYGVGFPEAIGLLEKYKEKITGIEGHNSQMVWPEIFWSLPMIGNYNYGVNRRAKSLANFVGKPYIATSDAHIPQHTGISSIEFESHFLDTKSEESFKTSLKKIVRARLFENHEAYAGKLSWLKWTSQFYRGTR